MSPIRVFLVDDHPIVRKGLRTLLEEQGDIVVVGESGSGQQALYEIPRVKPDVVVMDIALPDVNGIEVTHQVRRYTQVVILSMYDGREFVRQAIRAGAKAYVLKESVLSDLVTAVRFAVVGRPFASAKASTFVEVNGLFSQSEGDSGDPFNTLTPRERQVLLLVAEGFTTREIATRLQISPKTVDAHRVNAMRKLDLHSAVEVTRYLQRRGLLT